MPDPTLTHPPEPDDTTLAAPPGPDAPAEAAGPAAAPPGYRLLSLVGQGGMGVVYRARDTALDRDVAVKILLDRYPADSPTARRFLDEARITGRLQHPGIPAVHQVGTLPGGRPFLAMKLIKGRTLDELLKERPDPGADRGRFVAVFEQVCQAVAFAHSQGVIHRDLKPANVMVGAFGEVQVMDWGLARVGKDEGGRMTADEPRDVPGSSPVQHPSSLTQAGAILGTPAYMPPEQARGETDRVGPASDVFGLGAVLCVILTGKPPFGGDRAESTWQQASRADLADARGRLDGCGAEPELVALAKRCLAPDPAGRPRDAGEVAAAVAGLRADAERRAKEAEVERARAEVRAAEERKRRRVRRALALSVLGLLAVAGFAGWWVDHERAARRADEQARELAAAAERKEREADRKARQLATERDVYAALNEVEVLRGEGLKQIDDPERWRLTLAAARSALRRAEGLLAAGEPGGELPAAVLAAAGALDDDDRDRALIAELDRIADENDIRYLLPTSLTDRVSRLYAAAFRAHGLDLAAVPRDEAVGWLKGHRFRDRLTDAVRDWQEACPLLEGGLRTDLTFLTAAPAASAVAGAPAVAAVLHRPSLGDRLAAVLDEVTEDPFAREWWAAVARRDAAGLKALLARPELARMSSRELASLAEGVSGYLAGNDAILAGLARAAYDRFPGEFWVHMRLAAAAGLGGKDDREEILRHVTAAVAARPRSVAARLALGMALIEAERDVPAGFRLLRSAADLDPASPWPHVMIGMMGVQTGNAGDAIAGFRQAVRLDPDAAFFMASVLVMMPAGSAEKGLPRDQFLRLCDELIAARPDHPGGYDMRGRFHAQTDPRAALADFRAALAVMRPDYPQRIMVQTELQRLEPFAAWGEKLPAVLRGELRPATAAEWLELAKYCAGFDKTYALAARFAAEALAAESKAAPNTPGIMTPIEAAGWAVRAGLGHGADAADLPPAERARLRKQALAWLRAAARPKDGPPSPAFGLLANQNENLKPTRDPEVLATLPADEREAWERFWASLPDPRRPAALPAAPLPREVGR